MKIIKLSAIDSTNSYLKELSKDHAVEDGLVVVATRQTHGRGQMGSQWLSQPSKSLTFSMFKRLDGLPAKESATLLFAVSLAIKVALERFEIPTLSIKWPNDIMSYDKKIGGILIENQVQGSNIAGSIIGVGLNVNNEALSELPQASSLHLITGKRYDLDTVLTAVAAEIQLQLQQVATSPSEKIQEAYETNMFRKGKVSVFEDAFSNRFNGIIVGVTAQGKLKISMEDDLVQEFGLKEIKLLF
ncbi:biotin--[acetyl-CoA-carboxylase] ligase [Altibacter lentus]|uniref:biotin--[acetyl-CoA-carboxylase] ligase n=1 Tax=Altibacter lentus TaxID=1223410 RepID=UPI0005517415|nr:biotin--[acetyl-CoA-carboxylase] ligase [Altibacter lentus]